MLFVDCDDTLILWDTEPNGLGSYGYHLNHELIEAVLKYMAITKDNLVVWSGGGEEYARRWARCSFPDTEWEAISKDITLPDAELDDVCVDDMDIIPAAPVFTWQEFVKMVAEWEVHD